MTLCVPGTGHTLHCSYTMKRNLMAACGPPKVKITPEVATAKFVSPDGGRLDMMNANEHYLFHGTKPECVDVLTHRGFDERVGELGGLFGAGCYFAENSSKSDQYVPPDSAGQFMFICRVRDRFCGGCSWLVFRPCD
jgi:hypothetical protein